MADAKPVKKSEDIPADTKVKVKNISKKTLNLSTGELEVGKSGVCTMAELQLLNKHLEKV